MSVHHDPRGGSQKGERARWHDATEEPPTGTVLWVYLGHDRGLARIEMGTWGSNGWRSALNPDVEYDAEAVSAWSVVDYPENPVRRWEAPDSGRSEPSSKDQSPA